MKRVGNYYYQIQVVYGAVVHRGVAQAQSPARAARVRCRKISGVEMTERQNGVTDFKVTQEGLKNMRQKSLVIIGDPHRVWTPARIIKFAYRAQIMGFGELVETGENAGRRKGNIKF